jgi:hypothetical protein
MESSNVPATLAGTKAMRRLARFIKHLRLTSTLANNIGSLLVLTAKLKPFRIFLPKRPRRRNQRTSCYVSQSWGIQIRHPGHSNSIRSQTAELPLKWIFRPALAILSKVSLSRSFVFRWCVAFSFSSSDSICTRVQMACVDFRESFLPPAFPSATSLARDA